MLRLKVGSDKLSRPEHMTHLPFLVPPKLIAMCCLAMLAIAPPVMAQSSDAAGRVKTSIGSASIVRGGQSAPAAVGALVYESDLLRTGADGQLAVMLKDDTRISLGPDRRSRWPPSPMHLRTAVSPWCCVSREVPWPTCRAASPS